MEWRHWTVAFTVLFLGFSASAQQSILTISHENGGIEKRIVLGDHVKIQKANGESVSGAISSFDSVVIQIDTHTVFIEQIKWIKTYNKAMQYIGARVLSGGVLYLVVAGVTGLVQGYKPVYNNNDFIISGSFFAAGGIFLALSDKKYKMRKYRIEFVSFENLNAK